MPSLNEGRADLQEYAARLQPSARIADLSVLRHVTLSPELDDERFDRALDSILAGFAAAHGLV